MDKLAMGHGYIDQAIKQLIPYRFLIATITEQSQHGRCIDNISNHKLK